MIQIFNGKTKEVELDVRANAMMAGEFGPLFETSKDRNAGSVNFFAHEDAGGRVVVFCDGIRFGFKKWNQLKYQVSQFPDLMCRFDLTFWKPQLVVKGPPSDPRP